MGTPWIALGDFNQVLYYSEHSTADAYYSSRGMRDFLNCIEASALSDLPFCGNTFTWSNKQGSTVVSKKLDRILVNDDWLFRFPNSIGVFGDPGISDHAPSWVFLDSHKPKVKRPFKFFSMLNDHPDIGTLVNECWNSLQFEGTMMLKVSKKLKTMKSIIRSFSRENFSGLEMRVKESFEVLLAFQHVLLNAPTALAAQEERKAFARWSELAKAKDSFLLQRSHVNWLDKGDSGSSFFHRSIRSRISQNQITLLLDDDDSILETKEEIMQHAVAFIKTCWE